MTRRRQVYAAVTVGLLAAAPITAGTLLSLGYRSFAYYGRLVAR